MDSNSPFVALLVGQPTLRRRIKLGTFAALDQRIALRCAMGGMDAPEKSGYVTHHVKLAGWSDTLFSDEATALIHQVSRGLTPSGEQPRRPSTRSPPTPPTKPSSTNPAPEPPSPKSRQNDDDADALNTKPRRHQPAGRRPARTTSARPRSPSSSFRASVNKGHAPDRRHLRNMAGRGREQLSTHPDRHRRRTTARQPAEDPARDPAIHRGASP
jgi:hypothetical protein